MIHTLLFTIITTVACRALGRPTCALIHGGWPQMFLLRRYHPTNGHFCSSLNLNDLQFLQIWEVREVNSGQNTLRKTNRAVKNIDHFEDVNNLHKRQVRWPRWPRWPWFSHGQSLVRQGADHTVWHSALRGHDSVKGWQIPRNWQEDLPGGTKVVSNSGPSWSFSVHG